MRSEPCQRFFRDGLTTSFTKILTDEAVSGWKFEIHVSDLENKGITFRQIRVLNVTPGTIPILKRIKCPYRELVCKRIN